MTQGTSITNNNTNSTNNSNITMNMNGVSSGPSPSANAAVISKPLIRISYQGEPGCNSQAAIYELFNIIAKQEIGQSSTYHDLPYAIETIANETFSVAFLSIDEGQADYAFIPFESSIGGTVHDNYDLIAEHQLHAIVELRS